MSEELTQKVIAIIAENQKLAPEKVTIDSTFEELGIDSLDGVNILFALENEFNINIPDDKVQEVRSVRAMIDSLDKLMSGQGTGEQTAANA